MDLNYLGSDWQAISNSHFHILNNIINFFTHFFTHTYFKKLQTTLLKLLYQTPPYYFQFLIFFWLISSVNDSDCGFVCLLYALIFSLFFLGLSWGFFGFPGFVVVFVHYCLGRAWLFFIQEVIE